MWVRIFDVSDDGRFGKSTFCCICKSSRTQTFPAAANSLFYFRDHLDDGYVLAETCSFSYFIKKKCVRTEYVTPQVRANNFNAIPFRF